MNEKSYTTIVFKSSTSKYQSVLGKQKDSLNQNTMVGYNSEINRLLQI